MTYAKINVVRAAAHVILGTEPTEPQDVAAFEYIKEIGVQKLFEEFDKSEKLSGRGTREMIGAFMITEVTMGMLNEKVFEGNPVANMLKAALGVSVLKADA